MSLKVTCSRSCPRIFAKTPVDVHRVWYAANLHFAMDSDWCYVMSAIAWNVRVVIGSVSNLSRRLLFAFRHSVDDV